MSEIGQGLLRSFRNVLYQDKSIDAATKSALAAEVDWTYEREPLPTLVIIGETGVGKSTTINALFNAGQEVGHSRATTKTAAGFDVFIDHVRGGRGDLRVYDMPGIGDDIRQYENHLRLYLDVLPQADVILWVHPASDRMIQFTQQAVEDLFRQLPDLRSRLVFGLNKADEIFPNDWNPFSNAPSRKQEANLAERVKDFAELMRPSLHSSKISAVSYSALRRYNLAALFRHLMYAVPKKRRWVLESRMDLADFIELVDQGLLKIAKGRIRTPAHNGPAPGQLPADEAQLEVTSHRAHGR